MFDNIRQQVDEVNRITIVQAENPDGDSLGSALALEEILSDIGKDVSLYCPVEIPKYMRYINGWDRVESDFDTTADLIIIVDTTAEVLLTKVLETPGIRHYLNSHPVIIIDHHSDDSDISFPHLLLSGNTVSTAEIIYELADNSGWAVNKTAAENLMIAIMSDSLGLTIKNVTPKTYQIVSKLAECGASNYDIELRRREFMKKPADILRYKGELLQRIDYYLDGKLAIIHIPWEEIEKYSDKYNPSVLVLDEMRLVEGVELGVAIKTYPDGKLTGKLRGNLPIAATVAGFFGGGGHDYAAGFRVYESIDKIISELLDATDKAMQDYHNDN